MNERVNLSERRWVNLSERYRVKTAMEHNVDNRMMNKAGVAALRLDILNPGNLIIGIPLSATGKNIYFDRADKLDSWKIIKFYKNNTTCGDDFKS